MFLNQAATFFQQEIQCTVSLTSLMYHSRQAHNVAICVKHCCIAPSVENMSVTGKQLQDIVREHVSDILEKYD